MISHLRTSRTNSSEVMGCLRKCAFDIGVGEPAQVGVKIGGEVEVVPGVFSVAVPQMQAQVGDEGFRIAAGEDPPVDVLDHVGVAQVVEPRR